MTDAPFTPRDDDVSWRDRIVAAILYKPQSYTEQMTHLRLAVLFGIWILAIGAAIVVFSVAVAVAIVAFRLIGVG